MRTAWMGRTLVAMLAGVLVVGCGGQQKGVDPAGTSGGDTADEAGPGPEGKTLSPDLTTPEVTVPQVPGPSSPDPSEGLDTGIDLPLCRHCGGEFDVTCPPYKPPCGWDFKDRFCRTFWEEKDISFVLVHVPCTDLVEDIYLDTGKRVLLPKPSEPSNCAENLVGYKFEGINTQMVEVCLETKVPIDPRSISVQVKTGDGCETVIDGSRPCLCDGAYQ